MTAIPTPRRQKQEDQEFKAILSHVVEFEASLDGLHELSELCGVQTSHPVKRTSCEKGCGGRTEAGGTQRDPSLSQGAERELVLRSFA